MIHIHRFHMIGSDARAMGRVLDLVRKGKGEGGLRNSGAAIKYSIDPI